MGNYVFTTKALIEALHRDAEDGQSVHDMGGSILPQLTARGEAQLYDFSDNHVLGETSRDQGYWRDVGTLDAYYEAHMDLIAERPAFNLYNRQWPIYTHSNQLSPAPLQRGGIASESIISAGCLIRGQVTRSVLSPGRPRRPGRGRPGLGAALQRAHRPGRGGPRRRPGQERRGTAGRDDRRQPGARRRAVHRLRGRRHRAGQGPAGALTDGASGAFAARRVMHISSRMPGFASSAVQDAGNDVQPAEVIRHERDPAHAAVPGRG